MRSTNSFTGAVLAVVALLLANCGGTAVQTPPTEPPPDSSEPVEEVTHNVTYRGTLDEAPVGIYMQGTHRLMLDFGRFLLLESDTIPLASYVGEDVEVTGDVRSTVEDGGLIMSVKSIVSLVQSSLGAVSSETAESSSSTESSDSSTSSAAEFMSSSFSSVSSLSQRSSVPQVPTSESTSAAASTASSMPIASSSPSGAKVLRVKEMTAVNMHPSNWTQKYCTGHIGFCIPVHKNWWYKSFGATTSSFWHVEISSREIESLGEGPIVLSLVAGAASESDRSVVESGTDLIGYYSWTGDRHFEVRAPSELRVALEYIIQNLTPYVEE